MRATAGTLLSLLALAAGSLAGPRRAPAEDVGSQQPERITAETAARLDLVLSLTGPTDWARCVVWQPGTTRVYAGCKDGVLYIWDVEKTDLPSRVPAAPC